MLVCIFFLSHRTGYQPGSIVIYALNLNSESVNLTFQSLVSDSSNIHVYLLQPADGDILSRYLILYSLHAG